MSLWWEPPVSYLESTVPAAAYQMVIISRSVGSAYLIYRVLSL
jgi:hypothetical protein